MDKPTKEQYERALKVNDRLRMNILYDEEEFIKCIDKLCYLRGKILSNKQIIEQNEEVIISKYKTCE